MHISKVYPYYCGKSQGLIEILKINQVWYTRYYYADKNKKYYQKKKKYIYIV